MPSPAPDLKIIFGQALEIDSPEKRAAFLDQACAGNAKLREEVESLLQAIGKAGR